MSLRTPLCDLLGIETPILNVGFGVSATAELAAAVSNAGGLGVMGLGVPPDEVRRRIADARVRTARSFGGNIVIAAFGSPHATDAARAARRAQIDAALAERIPVLVLFWGDPTPFIAPAHAAGTKVVIQVGSPEEAAAAARAGVDAIIVQGLEAGGHVKAKRSIWEVLPEAARRVGDVPLIASGGIGDGVAIARALRLGAQGVSLGTRFVAAAETWVHAHYKERLVAARAEDALYTADLYHDGWPDAPHRALRNRTYAIWDAAGRPAPGGKPGEGEVIGSQRMPWGEVPMRRYEVGMLTPTFTGDPDEAVMWAGESVDAVREILPAAEIVRRLAAEAEAAFASAPA